MPDSRRSIKLDPKRPNRSWMFDRTTHRPGFGLCGCAVCSAEYGRMDRTPVSRQRRIGEFVPGCQYVNREHVFAEEWEEYCEPNTGLNYGQGLVQDLFCDEGESLFFVFGGRMLLRLSDQERMVAATVVQWLGTNVGWAFLDKCLRRCGYRLEPLAPPTGAGTVPAEGGTDG